MPAPWKRWPQRPARVKAGTHGAGSGDNARANRVTLCAWHHLRGIHAGVVRAWGEAPHAITWEMGVRAGRRPLLRIEGIRLAAAVSDARPAASMTAAADAR